MTPRTTQARAVLAVCAGALLYALPAWPAPLTQVGVALSELKQPLCAAAEDCAQASAEREQRVRAFIEAAVEAEATRAPACLRAVELPPEVLALHGVDPETPNAVVIAVAARGLAISSLVGTPCGAALCHWSLLIDLRTNEQYCTEVSTREG